MGEKSREERRRSFRFHTPLKVLYYLEGEKEKLEKGRVLDVSYKGLGIAFDSARVEIEEGSLLHCGIINPWKLSPLGVKGVVKWVEKEKEHLRGGIELVEEIDNLNLIKLF
jgi:hypothetical protein